MNPKAIRNGLLGGLLLWALIIWAATAALGQTITYVIPIDQQVVRQPPGLYPLAEIATPDGAGLVCDVEFRGDNNASVHPGNNLIVTSANSVTLYDVEREPGAVTVADGRLELADTVIVTLDLAEGQLPGLGIFSAGGDIIITCEEVPPSTTSAPTTTTSTTSPPPTTTTSVPSTSTSLSPPSTTPPTTLPPATSSTSTSPTTTSPASGPPSTTSPPSTTPPNDGSTTTQERLPDTGLGAIHGIALALTLLCGGSGALALATRRAD